jgi:hypothetical protein
MFKFKLEVALHQSPKISLDFNIYQIIMETTREKILTLIIEERVRENIFRIWMETIKGKILIPITEVKVKNDL